MAPSELDAAVPAVEDAANEPVDDSTDAVDNWVDDATVDSGVVGSTQDPSDESGHVPKSIHTSIATPSRGQQHISEAGK